MMRRVFTPSRWRRPRLTPRRIALLASVLWTLAVTLLLSWTLVSGRTPDLLRRVDLWIYDAWVRTTLQPQGDPQVTVVALDEDSLDRHGQWPWPRDRVAELVQRLFDDYGVRALAFDIVFAEPDRSDAQTLREQLARSPAARSPALQRALDSWLANLDRDATLARALQGRPVVLGYYFSSRLGRRAGALPEPFLPVDFAHEMGLWPPQGQGHGANLPALMDAAGRAGHFNPSPDIDGVTRRAALLVEHEGMLYPSLLLATLTMLAGKDAAVDFGREATWDGRSVTEFLTVGPFRLPVDERARTLVPFFGPAGSMPTVSATQVLTGRADPAQLKDRVIVLGATAPGLKDARVTPVDGGQSGVEIHASLLQGALQGRLPSQPHYTVAATLTTMWVISLLMMAGSRRLRLAQFSLAALVTAGAVLMLGGWLWSQHRVVLPVALPLLQVLLLLLGLAVMGNLLENRSKQAINRLFGQYVPPELIGEMNEDPARYSMSARSAELTVMFADMRGFTTLSERMEPAQLAALMNAVLTDLSRVIRADHLGTIDKYIGDCVMAFWGAPVQRADHAAAAVAAALDMTRSLERLLPALEMPAGATVAVGIGLQTGPAVVGNMGSAYRIAYTVLGDTVNTASRLEGLTKAYGAAVVAGDAVKTAAEAAPAGRAFLWRRLDLVRVKGREAPLLLHEPLCRLGEATPALHDQVARHEAALDAYLGRDFAQARHSWVCLHEEHPCELYGLWAERAKAAEAHPPPPDWDGVWSHTTK